MLRFDSSPYFLPHAPGRRIRAALLTGACITALIVGEGHGARAEGPTGGNVVAGRATITSGANTTTITQSTSKALINWQSFSISSDSSVSFLQPNASAITLNRVLGNSASDIEGSLFATGRVWLINSNGILSARAARSMSAG